MTGVKKSGATSPAKPIPKTNNTSPGPKADASSSAISPDGVPSTPPPLDIYGKAHRQAVWSTVMGDAKGPNQPQYDWTKMPSADKKPVPLDNKWWQPGVDKLAKPLGKDLAKLAKPLSKITGIVGVDEKKLRKALKKAPKAAIEAGLKQGVKAAVQPAKDASVGPRNPTDMPAEVGTVKHFPGTPVTITNK